jgi:hypothetical protein
VEILQLDFVSYGFRISIKVEFNPHTVGRPILSTDDIINSIQNGDEFTLNFYTENAITAFIFFNQCIPQIINTHAWITSNSNDLKIIINITQDK